MCCICRYDMCNKCVTDIKCGHTICKPCFGKLRNCQCPMCRLEMRSCDKEVNKMLSQIGRRMKDDKEQAEINEAKLILERERKFESICDYAAELVLSLNDQPKEDIALACFRLMRHKFPTENIKSKPKLLIVPLRY